MPNIIGSIIFSKLSEAPHESDASGAYSLNFYSPDGIEGHNGEAGGYHWTRINFNASRCSSIYGNSTTVQPPAVTVRYYIRAK